MEYQLMKILRLLVPGFTLFIVVWATWGHFWRAFIAVVVVLAEGAFLELFGAYERDMEEYAERQAKADRRRW